MSLIIAHPACPVDIVSSQVALKVPYVEFTGIENQGVIEVNREVSEDVLAFFKRAFDIRFPIEHVVRASDEPFLFDDNLLMADNATSGFNYRVIPGTDQLSNHALGRAFDVNPRLNPYIRYENGQTIVAPPGAVWNPTERGTFTDEHTLVLFMKNRGWTWGGDWQESSGRTDYQHFEKP